MIVEYALPSLRDVLLGRFAVLAALAPVHTALLADADDSAWHRRMLAWLNLRALDAPDDVPPPAALLGQFEELFPISGQPTLTDFDIASNVERTFATITAGPDPFEAIADWALSATSDVYRGGSVEPLSDWPRLRIGWDSKKPHGLSTAHAITAMTVSPDPASAEVTLIYHPEGTDWETFAATPYVLLHEGICHVGQGQPWDARTGGGYGPGHSFREGWMDYVAYQVALALSDGPTESSAVDQLWFGSAAIVRKASAEYHGARYDTAGLHGKEERQHASRQKGREAATGLDRSLRKALGREQGRAAFLAGSVRLNSSSLSDAALQRFAASVQRAYSPERQSLTAPLVKRWSESWTATAEELAETNFI